MTSCNFCHPFSGYQNNSLRGRRIKGREGGLVECEREARSLGARGRRTKGREGGLVECEREARSLGARGRRTKGREGGS